MPGPQSVLAQVADRHALEFVNAFEADGFAFGVECDGQQTEPAIMFSFKSQRR